MINKLLKAAIVCCVLVGSSYANATLIDNDEYTTDTASGLDWLDWDTTRNLSGAAALASNAGWRYATGLETVGLLGRLGFLGGESEIGTGFRSDFTPGNRVRVDEFSDLFGDTCLGTGWSCSGSLAMVADWGGVGAWYSNSGTTTLIWKWTPWTAWFGAGVENAGIALVRETWKVSAPTTLAVMALGVLALGFRRFKKQS